MDAGLLASADADGHAVFDVADRIGLGIFQSDEGDHQIALSRCRDILVLRRDIFEEVRRNLGFIAFLFKGDAIDFLRFDEARLVVRVHLEDAVIPLLLGLQNSQGFVAVARSDDAVRDFPLEERCRFDIADVGQSDEIAVRAHAVGTAGAGIGRSQGGQFQIVDPVYLFQGITHVRSDGGPSRADVLEGSRCRKACRFFQFFDQLIAVEGVEQINITGTAVEDRKGQVAAIFHINPGRRLVGIAAVF